MRRIWRLVPALLLVALPACSAPTQLPPEGLSTPEVAARTSWVLSRTVSESEGIRITGGNMGHYDEATHLSLGRDANGLDTACYVTVSAPGQGGPTSMVGEKVETTVNGSPGFRNGADAEAPYLMWRYRRGAWAMVHCSSAEGARSLDVIADAVQFKPSPMRLPFGLAPLPGGYGLASVSSDSIQGSHAVYLGKVIADFGHADPDIVVSYETGPLKVDQPAGRPTIVNGRPAVLDEDREAPGVCVTEQQRSVCVRIYASDTGPYPDRCDEIPTLVRLAEGLRFAADLDDRSTWLDSSKALPQ